ncbi:MAG: DUF4065 domain-containing protein [Cardiobacteriaceae bacterium]|nr:DUF4065 domain-containing protein [Cardiobacteriaceae bacterium]
MTYPIYRAVDVADALVRLSLSEQKPLTNLKIQKLTYIVYGYWLGFTNFQLFQDTVEAWQYGPVIPELYKQLARHGANFIQEPILKKNTIPKDSDAYQLICAVYNKYKNLEAWQLVYLTHQPNTPWSQTEQALPNRKAVISPDVIRDYYKTHMIKPE